MLLLTLCINNFMLLLSFSIRIEVLFRNCDNRLQELDLNFRKRKTSELLYKYLHPIEEMLKIC